MAEYHRKMILYQAADISNSYIKLNVGRLPRQNQTILRLKTAFMSSSNYWNVQESNGHAERSVSPDERKHRQYSNILSWSWKLKREAEYPIHAYPYIHALFSSNTILQILQQIIENFTKLTMVYLKLYHI